MILIKEAPSPINKLNRGPAIEPAIPISPNPDLAKAQFRVRSGKELPKLNKVIPKKVGEILRITPNVCKISMSILATVHIHKIDITKENKHKVIMQLGNLFLYVNLEIMNEITNNTLVTPIEYFQ